MDIVMPQLGETVSEGTVTQWLKKAGETVKRDELLFVVGTDKAEMEIPAPADGVLLQILVQEGETVPVGTRLAVIGGDAAPAAPSEQRQEQRLSPVVKKLLAEHGVAADQVKGSGEGGRITREDVLAYVETKKPAAPAPAGPVVAETVPFSYRRKMIAEHMVRSLETSAHVVQAIEVEFDAVEKARGSLSYLPFIVKALCGAIREYPRVNATIDKDKLVVYRDINIAIAVDLAHEGLVTPVIKSADTLSVAEIAAAIKSLAEKARTNALTPDEMVHGTYTISNSGAYGTLFTASIINQPQVAILSTDGVKRKPVVVDEKIAIRSVGVLAQSFDHRAFDGAYSGAFLKRLKDIIETTAWMAAT